MNYLLFAPELLLYLLPLKNVTVDFNADSQKMIRSIFYAEFDNIKGPIVLFDAPQFSVSGHSSPQSASLFDAISDYAITGAGVN